MTQEEAIRQLKNQIVPNGQPASIEAIAMAVSALEKEKEPAPSANGTSPKNNFTNKNDNTEKGFCQEAVEISSRWVKDMIRLADRYSKDRNALIYEQIQLIEILISVSDFNNYRTKEE